MMKRFFLMGVALFLIFPVWSQETKGIILNAKQRPLKGMKVWKKNTTESTETNKMGVFMFSPQLLSTDTLVVSVSRKEEAVIPVGQMKEFAIKLDKKFYILKDGDKEYKKDYNKVFRASTSSNVLTRDQIAKLSANSLYDILKGSIAGVSVNEGANGTQVSIRGGNSFDLNTEPLFVIDGTLYENSTDADSAVSVNDIDRIEVQKDGSAYCMKGANGAIIITTIKN